MGGTKNKKQKQDTKGSSCSKQMQAPGVFKIRYGSKALITSLQRTQKNPCWLPLRVILLLFSSPSPCLPSPFCGPLSRAAASSLSSAEHTRAQPASERGRYRKGEDERLRDCSWRRQFWLFYDLLIAIAVHLLTTYHISFFWRVKFRQKCEKKILMEYFIAIFPLSQIWL